MLQGPGQEPGPLITVHRFRGEPRGGPRQLLPGHLPEGDRLCVAVGEHRIGLGAVRDHHERGQEEPLRLLGSRARAGDEFAADESGERVEQELDMRGGGGHRITRFHVGPAATTSGPAAAA